MKKQVKSFGEFTRRKINEDHFFPEPYGEESEFEIGDQVYVAGMEDIPGRVVGFDEDEYGSPLVVVRIAGEEEGYRKSDVYKLDSNRTPILGR